MFKHATSNTAYVRESVTLTHTVVGTTRRNGRQFGVGGESIRSVVHYRVSIVANSKALNSVPAVLLEVEFHT